MNIVWFKRDIRLLDHQPLADAASLGEVLPIFIVEPSVWQGKELTRRHYEFILEGLEVLAEELQKRGGNLFFAIAEMCEVLEHLQQTYGDFTLFAYEDKDNEQVGLWMREKELLFRQYPKIEQNSHIAVGNLTRTRWDKVMSMQETKPPPRIHQPNQVPEILHSKIEKLKLYPIPGHLIRYGQKGGESEAIETLETFIRDRYHYYLERSQNPIQSSLSSSRLSPYLAWGNISTRTVYKRVKEQLITPRDENQQKQLESLLTKLFLYDQTFLRVKNNPDIIDKSMLSSIDDLKGEWDEDLSKKWIAGKTGIPMIDATLRCLRQTGWINDSLRRMLVSFISYTMLKKWQKPAKELAQLLLDYQPAIHYYQVQMCAGAFNGEKVTVYDPIKYGKKFDPEGAFIRRYVPELSCLPNKHIHEPWYYPGFYSLGYPVPIIDVSKANKKAKQLYMTARFRKKAEGKALIDSEQLSLDL